ncbi:hypothetical protein NQ315_005690 [Exocentrus adspersus]|uniref:DDE Tnp4 domain-containing protein n=1 Tax=Exocentrus adspersus TaxID=1586481 RepID=A0AAV8VI60_9CUCU|nr:hypothetical protein NQ315_005690 [Exocentrus adspersus]
MSTKFCLSCIVNSSSNFIGLQLIFNIVITQYMLCRARRVIENVFGILAARWRIYRKAIIASQPTVIAIVKATICLHNYIMNCESKAGNEKRYCSSLTIDREDEFGGVIGGDWRKEPSNNLISVGRTSTNMYGRVAETMRERLSKYFVGQGAVAFQWDK